MLRPFYSISLYNEKKREWELVSIAHCLPDARHLAKNMGKITNRRSKITKEQLITVYSKRGKKEYPL